MAMILENFLTTSFQNVRSSKRTDELHTVLLNEVLNANPDLAELNWQFEYKLPEDAFGGTFDIDIAGFDDNGELARAGQVNDLIFNQAVENFSCTSYDKSLDIRNYDISFVRGLSLEDGCATITKFTAFLIAEGLRMVSNQDNLIPKINILCGGGRKNKSLIDYLKFFLQDSSIKFTDIDEYELDGDYIESQAFGYLSIRSFLNLPISFPHTTRCKSPTLGGKINKNF